MAFVITNPIHKMNHFKIHDGKKFIYIKSVDDLWLLPDKSINILAMNQDYMATLYVYILYRMDAYLQIKKYSNKIRVEYFDICVKNYSLFAEYQKKFLNNSSTLVRLTIEGTPKNLKKIYRESLIVVCHFFSGILSTTPYLDTSIFSRDDIKIIKHNYANMISALIAQLNYTK